MNESQPAISESLRADAWLDGYRAAIADSVAIVDALGGPNFQGLSAPILLRLKMRFMELTRTRRREAA